ncbi:MAG: HAMP domain-containing histidine kinase, partial [Ruminococcus sp.]|nr:HAMP domain-containing histidine kinase [Ruminococcus sp.]
SEPSAENGQPKKDFHDFHHQFGDETPIEISSYVIVKTGANGAILDTTENDLSIDREVLAACVQKALQSGSGYGQLDEYGLMFAVRTNAYHSRLIFASNSSVYTSLINSILISLLLFAGSMAVIFGISLILSNLAVKPVQTAWEQQKQFVADASHELKTPLTVILANNNIMLSHQSSTVAEERQWLESTEEEANHMKKLIENMLFLAKSDAGTAKVQLCAVNFSEIVEGCALHFEPVAFEREIMIDADGIEEDVILQGDPTQLNQLAHILTDNAVKYASPGTTVTIRLQAAGDRAEFSVNNRGNVIAKDELGHIFDRFYRAEKSRTTKGYGLGLSIAQRIVESMNGKITVESNDADGTTFSVRFGRSTK